jgi:sporulation protein YlmC with PRC-barrel domain
MNGKAKLVRVSWMAGALLPLLAGITSAANMNSTAPVTNQPMQQDQQVATSPEQTAQFQPHLEKAKDIIGAKVVNERGEQLGKIEDVVLTPDRSGINYVVMAHGGTWGAGEKYFAVPWSQFGAGENAKTFVLKGNISKADLGRAPGFDKKHWPATANENWLGTERGSATAPSGGMMPQGNTSMPAEQQGTSRTPMYGAAQPMDIQHLRLSKLFGTTVRDAQNENIGRLDNAMIDTNQGKLAYGIVAARHDSLGRGKDFVAVPWSALDWSSQPGIAKVNVDRQTLASLAFRRDNFPNFADPQYSRQLFERFHAMPYWQTPSLGFIPGEENRSGNLPSSGMTPPESGMVPPDSRMTAPNTAAPNVAAPEMVAYTDIPAVPYNPNTVQTFRGRVEKITTSPIRGTSMSELYLTVKAENGRTIQVDAGPVAYSQHHNVIFQRGDPVTVTGSLARVGHHNIFAAAQIRTPYRTLNLRNPEGVPLWNLDRSWNPYAYGRGYDQYYGRGYDRYEHPYQY